MPARHAIAATCLAATLSASALAQSSAAPVDCAAPRGIDQRRACEAAREGTTQLRRFALMTRHFYAVVPQRYAKTALEADGRQGLAADAPPQAVATAK
ncbi:MAG: hypothetical protein KJ018_00860 [Burkholderiales bacterium]|nr:hypothetical protein [Burkholderiales bacterium]